MKRLILASILLVAVVSNSFSTPLIPKFSEKHITINPFGSTKMWSPQLTTTCIPVTWEIGMNVDPGTYAGSVRFIAGTGWYIEVDGYVSLQTAQDIWYYATMYDGDDYIILNIIDGYLRDIGNYNAVYVGGMCTYLVN